MTLTQIKSSRLDFLTPADIAEVLGCQPHSINVQAQADPAKLGFPVVVIGTRVKIPRVPFVRFMTVGNAPTIEKGETL